MNKLLALILMAGAACSAYAQTYYVDTAGNDAWNGTLPDPQGGNGPWQSIAKVNASIFQPGDSILFRCGDTWHETLVIPNSGTTGAGNAITFGNYGPSCTAANKPVISGADAVSGWTVFSGNIYSVPFAVFKTPLNKIFNDRFDANYAAWSKSPVDSSQSWQSACTTVGGGCMNFTASTGTTSSLAISNVFSVEQGKSYTLKFSLAAGLPNQSVRVYVRRNGQPDYSSVGLNRLFTAGTAWQPYELTFDASSTEVNNARVDFEVSNGQTIYLDDVSLVQVTPEPADVQQVFVDGVPMTIAHHPNRGYLQQQPSSVYFSIAQNSPLGSTGKGSDYFTAGSDLALTNSQSQDMVGAGVHTRSGNYTIDDLTVAAFDPATLRITLNKPSSYQLAKGWGYYLDNKLWMLDEPGEWFYDRAAQNLYLRMPDDSDPGTRVEIGYRDYGVSGRSRFNVVVDGLNIQRANTGVDFSYAGAFTLRNTDIADSAAFGVTGSYASDGVVDACTITDSGNGGIQAKYSYRLSVTNNQVSNSGVRFTGASIASLPLSGGTGIMLSGDGNYLNNPVPNPVTIARNTVRNSAYDGIGFGRMTASVLNNVVENSCWVLDDCGSVHTDGKYNNSQITGNIVIGAYGNPDGRPVATPSSAQGLYLDDFTQGVSVTGNTVINADNAVQVHHSFDNTFSGNTFYGTRQNVMWFQENTTAGAIHDNQITDNILFPSNTNPAIKLADSFQEILLSGTGRNYFDTNQYSGLYTDYVVQDSYPSNNLFLTLPQWQTDKDMDAAGSLFAPFAIRPYRVLSVNSNNFITNGTFDTGLTGWGHIPIDSTMKPAPQGCGASGNCMMFTAGSATSTAISNTYALDQTKRYLLEFKISADVNVNVGVAMIRNATPWENATSYQHISADTTWKRIALLSAPTETLSNARLDFDVPAGQTIYLDNVSLTEVTSEYHSDFGADSRILVNKGPDTQALGCPDSDPARCAAYIDLNGNPVSWPVTLAGYSSQVVVWNANPFKDTDRDWVTDGRDACPQSTQIADANAAGCAPTDLALTGTGPGTLYLGGPIDHNYTINNIGPDQGGNIKFTDTITGPVTNISATASQGGSCAVSTDGSTSTVTCDLGVLAPNASATVSVSGTAASTDPITEDAKVAGAATDIQPGNNELITTTSANPATDLSIAIADNPDPVLLNGTVTYTVTVTNNGPSAATNVVASGTLPTCTIGNLASGASGNCTSTVTASGVGTLTQSMSVSGTEYDPQTTNNSASTTTNVQAVLTLSKSGTGNGTVTSSPAGVDCGATCSAPYDANANVVLTAAAVNDSVFGAWSGCASTAGNSCTVTMNDSKTVTASFTLQTETITASASAGGTISPSGSLLVNYGASQTFTVTPDPGYTPTLQVDGVAVTLTNNAYTLSNITAPHTVTTSFAPNAVVTIFDGTDMPRNPRTTDTTAVELGVQFQASRAGLVRGIRFYKGSGNTGTHWAHLWSASGTLLASAKFVGETGSGWQQVNFATPVTITANTTYVASYLAPKSHYADDDHYFVTAKTSGPLTALASGSVANGNGVYHYGSTASSPLFPNTPYLETNYWVDVVFQ